MRRIKTLTAQRTPRRGNPEADLQRHVVQLLRAVLPAKAIVHHSANEVRRGGRDGRTDQSIAIGMGIYPGFSDLLVISEGRVMFLELKSATGTLSAAQRAFRDRVCAQGFPWALVRSVDDAMAALAAHGFQTRVREVRKVSP